jgi:hypothetical protein
MSHIFISYSRHDSSIVDRFRTDLNNAQIEVWIDEIGLTPGTPDWDEALRVAIKASDAVLLIASPASRQSPYVRDEIALARDAKKPIYPVWVRGDSWLDCVPMGMGSTQYVDLRGGTYTNGLTRLIGVLNKSLPQLPVEAIYSSPEEISADIEPRNPYKGLRAFREVDQKDFFGRELLVADLIAALGDGRSSPWFLAVLGASGSGKSSVMMAGLLPKLREGKTILGSNSWVYLETMTPGVHPVERLAIVLARHLQKSQVSIREDLDHRSSRGLHRLACEISSKPVVLYIDQFEELFTLTTDETERRQFIDLLTVAVSDPDGVFYVLLTMRADFYDRPTAYHEFAPLLEIIMCL